MIAIFSNQIDAVAYANKIHDYLKSNRPGYNAERWCIPEQSSDGTMWMVKAPVEHDNRIGNRIDNVVELTKAIAKTEPIPEVGRPLQSGKFYLHKGDVIKCQVSENRADAELINFPDKFKFFRDVKERLKWKEGEVVEPGWQRIHNDQPFEALKEHETDIKILPENKPDYWKAK